MSTKKFTIYKSGQAMLIAVVFFLFISLIIVVGIATPILKNVKDSTELIKSKETYFLAEAALEDGLYRLRSNLSLTSGDTITVNGYTSTITLTTLSSGKILTASANIGGRIRKMEAQVIEGSGASFNYGVQAGAGGFTLAGGSRINGNVYSNGNIVATNGVTITGSAVAANSSALVADQINATPVPISSCTASTCINFRNAAASQDVAQKFQVSTTSPINKIQLYIKKVGNPADASVRIVTDNAGSPSTNNMLTTNGTLSAALVSSSNFGWVDVSFSDNPALDPDVPYWFVIDSSSQNASNYYQIGANTSYGTGTAKVGAYNGTWNNTSPVGLDAYFQINLGGLYSTVGGGTYVGSVNIGSGGVGDAWGHTVKGASVAGTIYCAVGTTNNKACNTTRPDPSQQPMPVSEAIIQDWKDMATTTGSGWTYNGALTIGYAGTTTSTLQTINGNLTVNGGGVADMSDLVVNGNVQTTGGGHLKAGPMIINGNLTVNSNMTLKGTLWVTGTVTVSSGATVRLDSGFGSASGIIVADGNVSITGGTNFYGSGTTGSYPLIVTTSNCPVGPTCAGANAVEFSGGAGAVVIYAPYGTLHMAGGSSAKSLVANEIVVDGGGTVTYDTGVSNMTFSSGPSGGWEITRWEEVQ